MFSIRITLLFYTILNKQIVGAHGNIFHYDCTCKLN